MTNLDLAGGGAAAFFGGLLWAFIGLAILALRGSQIALILTLIGAVIATIGLIMVGLAPNDNMALGPEDLDE